MAHYKGAASEAGRAMQLMKKREMAQQETELKKKKMIEDDLKLHNIDNKFSTHYSVVEQQLKSSTIGLVTLNEMKAKQEDMAQERVKKLAQKTREKEQEKERELAAKQAEKKKQKRQIQTLSFTLNEYDDENEEKKEDKEKEEEEEEGEKDILSSKELKKLKKKKKKQEIKEDSCEINSAFAKKVKKNPDVDTSFLPDREREEEENRLREKLRQEWETRQIALKAEEIEITFSYWDGSGHRRSVVMKKGI